ncbi:hypothetical protein [Kribbella deserti]|uniref:Uncharacterized protein n=1 Tax=Kribbella deserti TaxID=1926257 RepID=A0ABV6QRN4_9ACTN
MAGRGRRWVEVDVVDVVVGVVGVVPRSAAEYLRDYLVGTG